MSTALTFGCLWVFLSAIVAMLPMRWQYVPGVTLLILAPLLLGWIAMVHGWWLFFVGLFAFVSMFRNPLRHFWNKWRGKQPSGGAS